MAEEAMPAPTPAPAPAAPVAPSTTPVKAGGYVSNPLSLLPISIDALKVNLKPLIGLLATLIGLGILAGVLGVAAIVGAGPIGILLMGVVALAIVAIAGPASTILILASCKGQKTTLKAALQRSPHFALSFIVLGILTVLAVLGGLLLLIVPGIIFLAWFSMAAYVLVEEDISAIESMKRSKQLVKGRVVEALGVILFGSALGILGIVPVIGAIAASILTVLYMAAPTVRYLQLKSLAPGTPVKVHWANWVVIVLAILASGMNYQNKPKEPQPGQPNNQYDFEYNSEN